MQKTFRQLAKERGGVDKLNQGLIAADFFKIATIRNGQAKGICLNLQWSDKQPEYDIFFRPKDIEKLISSIRLSAYTLNPDQAYRVNILEKYKKAALEGITPDLEEVNPGEELILKYISPDANFVDFPALRL